MEKYLKGKRSIIWNFFEPVDETKAKCNFCKHVISYKSSISNLKQHVQKKHPSIKISTGTPKEKPIQAQNEIPDSDPDTMDDVNGNNVNDPPSLPSTSRCRSPILPEKQKQKKQLNQTTLRVPKKVGFLQKQKLDDSLLKLVTKDFQPFSIVEDVGFREYTYALNQSYSLPSRKTLSNVLLPAKFEEVHQKTREVLKNAKSVTITTDSWTSCNNDGFIGVTAHFIDNNFELKSILLEVDSSSINHTSQNLARELDRITSDWGLQDKILLCLSDNAANIKKAIIDELHWKHLGCVAHTVNLIVKDALELELVNPLISKISNIVSHFKRSTIAKNKLDFYQKQSDKPPKRLIQSVATRWNSVYYMLDRITELKEEVRASLAALGKEDWPMLSNQEFEYVGELLNILAPLESVTVLMSAEKHVTLSSVIIITNSIRDLYKEMNNKTEGLISDLSKSVIQKILSGIEMRFKNLENSSTLLLSTLLDPRFKHIGFSQESVSERAVALARNTLTAFIQNEESENRTSNLGSESAVQDLEERTPEDNKMSMIWSSFDKKASQFVPSGTRRSKAIVEVDRYLEEPLLKRSENPLEWWRKNAYNYPHLSELVKLKFGTVATSVPCERLFSKSGQLISDRRNRITSDKVKQIMFVNQNQNN